MKTIKSFSVDVEIALRIDGMAEELRLSRSELIEKYVTEGLDRDSYSSLKCPKCGASYSSKLSECPGCRK